MSTSETDEYPIGACPCGKGTIVRSITTQDNPWSSADVHVYIDCPACSSHWRVERSKLVQTSTETSYKSARQHEHECWQRRHTFASALIDKYFDAFAAKTKKAEHAEMSRLDLFGGSYRDFLRRRKESPSLGAIALTTRNPTWLRSRAQADGAEAAFDHLTSELEIAREASEVSYKQIVRRPLPN
jgi:hypothetical protein